MALFSFGKKKETSCCANAQPEAKTSCCCGGQCEASETSEASNSRFIVLGACCQKSTETFSNVKQAVKELGFEDEVENIGDALEIAKYGVMQTPALVVDGKVVSYGKMLKVDDVKRIFSKLEVK
jgi:small redox-active disulfide protein 2